MRSPLLGTKRPNHKYIMRVETGGKGNYRYFYTQAEVDAYKKEQTQTIGNNSTTESENVKPKRKLKKASDNPTTSGKVAEEKNPGEYPKTENAVALIPGPPIMPNLNHLSKELRRERLEQMDYATYKYKGQMPQIVENRNIPPKVTDHIENILPKIEGEHTKDDDTLAVNPNYDERWLDGEVDDWGERIAWGMNCQNCTYAWVMRRRGYDVVAAPHNKNYGGYHTTTYREVFVNPMMVTIKDNKDKKQYALDMIEEMLSYGDNAYGEIGAFWIEGGGHSIVWSVENGEVVIRDAQTGHVYNTTESIIELVSRMITHSDEVEGQGFPEHLIATPGIFRLDDCDITDEIFKHVKSNKVASEFMKHTDLGSIPVDTFLAHHGILGQKWGVRRYQNRDGTLTPKGKARLQKYQYEQTNLLKTMSDKKFNQYLKSGEIDDLIAATKNMTYDDYVKEKAAVGRAYVKSAIMSVGISTLLIGSGIPLAWIEITDAQKAREKERIKNYRQKQARSKLRN